MDVLDFQKIIWEYTRKISENTNIAFNPICEKFGLTMLQVRILVELNQYPHTIGSLADSISIACTNISTMCKKLESKGYLERIRDHDDERVVKVFLTEKGNAIVAELDNFMSKKILAYLESEEIESLSAIINGLEKLNELLLKIGER